VNKRDARDVALILSKTQGACPALTQFARTGAIISWSEIKAELREIVWQDKAKSEICRGLRFWLDDHADSLIVSITGLEEFAKS
jgi:hypothetical protein